MEFTCATAERLGLRLAINLGQGWPPGGPWITDAHRTKHLSWKSQEVEGPGTFSREDLPAEGMVLAWKLAGEGQAKTVATNSFQDLTGLIQPEGSRRTLRWDVPPGRWLVGIFSVTPGGICDKGEGPEVDPASREAVLFHLDHMFSRLDPKLRRFYGTTLVDVASDSWEYEPPRGGGRYWSPAILDAFPQQAGYDLRERMHALLGYGPDSEQVRARLGGRRAAACSRELFRHRRAAFCTTRVAAPSAGLWPRSRAGFAPGLRAGGHAGNRARPLLPAGGAVGGAHDRQARSSQARRSPISAENSGWCAARMARGKATPAALRWRGQLIFGEGINRIQMHSFSYCPPGLPLPGWRMYAEIHLNRNVPWWPFMKPLNTWLARQQWLLQAGRPVADALVYPVKSHPDDGPFRRWATTSPSPPPTRWIAPTNTRWV